MKYCNNCGTLLEDSHEICIGCGADVTEPGSWSLYPPDMTEKIEREASEKKSRGGLIAAMIVVFILLIGAIAFFVFYNVSKTDTEELEADFTSDEYVEDDAFEDEEYEEASSEVYEEQSETVAEEVVDDREVKDSEGRYYNYGTVTDMGGNVVFSTIYPEDFSELASNINYDIYSTKYPECITYIVGNADGNVQMTYMSPQHYWYRKSDRGKTRSNEVDIYDYTQFLKYDGAQGYIEALIKQSYTDIKGFKLIDKEEYSPEKTAIIAEASNDHTMELTGEIGDYAKIAGDTVYAAKEAEYESYIYHYQATSRQGNTIYMDFFVPVIANKLGYVSDMESDKGVVTEWVVPQFVSFEAGNEELYNHYLDSYKLFIENSRPTEEFLYINKVYSDELETAIAAQGDIPKLSAEKLASIHSGYSEGVDLGEFGNNIRKILNTHPNTCAYFDGPKTLIALNNAKVAFFSEEKNKVFISPAGDEYPGSGFVDLVYHEPAVIEEVSEPEASGTDSSSEAGVS